MQFFILSEPMMLSVSFADVLPKLSLAAGPGCVDLLHCVVLVPLVALQIVMSAILQPCKVALWSCACCRHS